MPSSRLCPILIPLLQAAESILETIYRESVLAPSLECSIKQYNIQVCTSMYKHSGLHDMDELQVHVS